MKPGTPHLLVAVLLIAGSTLCLGYYLGSSRPPTECYSVCPEQPPCPEVATEQIESAHRRLDDLANALDSICPWIAGRARCPQLVQESRRR